jgi:hypothetical protein
MGAALANVQEMARETGALIGLVTHPGKDEGRGPRGWSGQVGNVDAIFYISKSVEDPALRLGVIQKLKDGADGETFAYKLAEIAMGTDADGDKITSAYPVFQNAPAPARKSRRQTIADKPGPALILRALHQIIEAGQPGQTEFVPVVPVVPGVKAGTVCVRRSTLRNKVMDLGYADPDEKVDTVKRTYNRDLVAMTAKQVIRIEGDLIWPLK